MEIGVYLNYDAFKAGKSVFKRNVLCVDALDYNDCVRTFKAIFGEKCIIEFIVV